jgi:hypothetical protein
MPVSLPTRLAGDRQRLICGERVGPCAVCSARARQGQAQSRPAGACQRGRRSKDITTWRWIGSIKPVVSCFARLSVSSTWVWVFGRGISYEASRLDYAEVQMAQVWHPRSTGCSSKGEVDYSSSGLLLTNVRCNSHYYISAPTILVISMLKETPASRRFVWCTARHVSMCLSVAGISYSVVRH